MSAPVAVPQLRAFIERVQRLDEERKAISDDIRDVYAEAKANGFDKAALKAVVSYLRKDPAKAAEQQAVFDLYLAAATGTERATRARATIPAADTSPLTSPPATATLPPRAAAEPVAQSPRVTGSPHSAIEAAGRTGPHPTGRIESAREPDLPAASTLSVDLNRIPQFLDRTEARA